MTRQHLSPQARRAQDASRARAETRDTQDGLAGWQIALFGFIASLIVLALI